MPSAIRSLLSASSRILLLGATLLATTCVHAQRIDMRNTMHNLARGETMTVTDPRQICVFCHTPTDANLADAAKPQWQPSVPQDTTFIMFDDIGQAGTEGNQSVGSQSIACLSCHDSSQAFGISGGSLDHPFAVPYRGALTPEQRQIAREQARKAGRLISQGQLIKFSDDFRRASRGVVDNRPAWWVPRDTPTAQRGRLDIPLYVRIDQEDQSEVPFVECASCHDPHTIRPLFLRAENNPSDLCMTCHVK